MLPRIDLTDIAVFVGLEAVKVSLTFGINPPPDDRATAARSTFKRFAAFFLLRKYHHKRAAPAKPKKIFFLFIKKAPFLPWVLGLNKVKVKILYKK